MAGYWALELQVAKGASLESSEFHSLAQILRNQIESHSDYQWRHLDLRTQYALATLLFTHGEGMYGK